MKRMLAFCLVMVLLMSGLMGFANIRAEGNKTGGGEMKNTVSLHSKSYVSHDPIAIDGNADFASQVSIEGWAGDGTKENPYMIENYDINASEAHGTYPEERYAGIHIVDTDVYFLIRNCVIHDGRTGNWETSHNGIYFYNVQNGRIGSVISYNNPRSIDMYSSSNNNITNCSVYNNSYYGIYLSDSSNNTVSNCSVYNNSDAGIILWESSNNTIIANQIYNNYDGIYLVYSSNNNLSGNQIYNNYDGIRFGSSSNNQIVNCTVYNNNEYGIYLGYSSNNKLRDNVLENNIYNFGLSGSYSHISDYYQDIDTSNTINGKPIYYIIEKNNLVFNETMSVGYLGLVSCSNIVIKNLALTNNCQGILLANTSYTTITNSYIYNNNQSGIFLYESSNNQIANCKIYNNPYGIHLYYYSSNNQITNCTVYNNSYDGIQLYSYYGGCNYNQITNCEVYNNSGDGIGLTFSSNNTITNCTVYNNYLGMRLQGASNNNIASNQIYNNSRDGIYLGYSSSNNQITNSAVYNNSHDGICLCSASNNEIHYNNIYNNMNYGIYNSVSELKYQVNATYNWLGSVDGPGGVGPGSGDAISSNVLYEPWLKGWDENILGNVALKPILVVNISNIYNYVRVNQMIEFNGSSSQSDYGTIVQYFFDFSDGNNIGWIDSQIVNYSYTVPGQYNITLKVKNDLGWISNWSTPIQITVFANIPPFAILQQVSSNYTYANISISGYSSFDFDGNVTQYFFDFGDNTTGWVSIPNITRQYSDSGYHIVRLKVKDNEGLESNWTDNITFYVYNRPPNAVISANPVVVEIGIPITFSGLNSYDLDGNVTQYYFDFGDDENTGWITDYSKSHLYMTSGVYDVTLKVKDDDGAVNADYIMVIVGQPSTPDNQLPVVDAGSNVTVYTDEPVLFNGTANDTDGYIIYYQWDFNGDGGYDWNSTDTGVTVHGYAVNGTYYAELRVYDNQGGFSTDTKKIIVKEGHAETITSSGGIVEYNNTIIIVPEGTATQNVTFTITKISTENPSGYIIIGDVCRIETDVTGFNQPMTLILSYNESNLPANVSEDDLAIYKKVGDSWLKLDSTVDKTNNTVSTQVTNFSDYTILYKQVSIPPVVGCIGCRLSEIPWLYIIIPVIIIIALIGAGVGIKKKTAGKTKKNTMKIRCPSCKTMFEVQQQERPFKVKCPKCGKEGTIK